MKKPKNVGKIIAVGTIMLSVFVAIMFVVLFNNWLNGDKVGELVGKSEQEILKEIQQINFYKNGWDKKIVAEIVDNEVPIPSGFEFVSGTKETGLIIRDKNTNLELMWIPYDENAKIEGIEEYYKNVEYKEIDSEAIESIEKYGGFYLTLEEINQYETLKSLDNNSYQTAMLEAEKTYQNNNIVYSDLLSLTELQQVLAFVEKSGIELIQTNTTGKTNIKTDKLIKIEGSLSKVSTQNKKAGLVSVKINGYSNPDEQDTKYDKDNISQIVLADVEGKEIQVPIPKGFKYNIIKKSNRNKIDIIKITDKKYDENNLSYIWIPVNSIESIESLEKAKEELSKLYDEYKIEKNNWANASDPTGTTEYKEMLASVTEYGGFFMGEAELGFDDKGNPYNKARGMEEAKVNLGEYYRTVNKEQIKEGITEKGGLEKNENGAYVLTYEKAKELASALNNESTVSHITYGAEWDAVMLWITKTRNASSMYGDIVKDVIQTSANMPGAKYSTNLQGENFISNNMTIETKNIQKINEIYGLAGNLCDLTQETIEENGVTYRILRGGGFATTGNETPMASRIKVENLESNDIGFRNCLYIKSKNIKIEIKDENTGEDNSISSGSDNVMSAGELVGNEGETKQDTPSAGNDNSISVWNGGVKQSFAGGDGTENNPYLIESGEELAYLAQIVNTKGEQCEGKYFKITRDIDLNNIKWTPIGNGKTPGTKFYASFKGVLDGDGHSIHGLKVEDDWRAGLVGTISGKAILKNITVKSGKVSNPYMAGAICGYIETIADNKIYTSYDEGPVIENCHNYCEVSASHSVGGIVGIAYGCATIRNCTNAGTINASTETVGGIVGSIMQTVLVSNCVNTGEVTAGVEKAGGIVGVVAINQIGGQQYKIADCTNKGKITAKKICGGILGVPLAKGTVENCKNEGELICSETPAGNIVGIRYDYK